MLEFPVATAFNETPLAPPLMRMRDPLASPIEPLMAESTTFWLIIAVCVKLFAAIVPLAVSENVLKAPEGCVELFSISSSVAGSAR